MRRNEDFDHPLIDDLFLDFKNISKETGEFIDDASQDAFNSHLQQLKEMVDTLQQDALFFFYIATLCDLDKQEFFLQLGILNTTEAMLLNTAYFEQNKKHHKWGNSIFALTLLIRRILSFREIDYTQATLPVGTIIRLTKLDDTVIHEERTALVLQDNEDKFGLKIFYTIPHNILLKTGAILEGYGVDTRPTEFRPEYEICGYMPVDGFKNLILQGDLSQETKRSLLENGLVLYDT